MVKGKTSSGFTYEVNENVGNDMELLDALAGASEEDLFAISRIPEIMLGKSQKKKLYDHLREEDGRVPIDRVVDECMEILAGVGEAGKK